MATADVVEDDDSTIGEERGGDITPHLLIGTEPVCEQHRPPGGIARNAHIVPLDG